MGLGPRGNDGSAIKNNQLGFAPSRRDFLRQSFAFSLVAGLGPAANALAEPVLRPDPSRAHLLCVGDWGTDRRPEQQAAVAQAMRMWASRYNVHPQALLMLGDNWYGELKDGPDAKRWQSGFEQMYPASHFPGPAYAILGNHDYERRGANKVEAELAYAQRGATRWRMPARWYRFAFPETDPLVTFLCLDSNLPGTKGWDLNPWSFTMSQTERMAQDAWFRQQLAAEKKTPFLVVAAHHPLYSNGMHGDAPILIRDWDALLREHKVDLYLTGHDHDLQHLEFADHPTSFVISGGGGAPLVEWSRPPDSRGPWGSRALGFTNLEVSAEALVVRHIGLQAQTVHAFRRDRTGRVTLL